MQRFRPGRGRGGGAGQGAGEVFIGHVGGLRSEKNQALLLRALACMEHRDRCRLEVVGDGPERSGLEELSSELGLSGRVSFVGECEDTAGVYSRWDIFALSSHTEQMPISVLEAMASGLPVVSTAVGDMAEMLGEESQLLVDAEPDAFAGALDRLVGCPTLRAELGEANRRRCEERYELKRSLSRYLEVYDQVLTLPA